ncbi:hypothetical protein GGD89_001709 [Roseospira visakhapatnamensis]|uniref:Uncharacterized protein n=1 Tax=Roseospira visakhapatnamensis TaxID=390880 RepID=A0A7W6RDV6_9PROT|nr:hypothetical protein [Roseospira visakhapatnamensis]
MTGTQYAFLDLGLFFGGLIGFILWDKAKLDRIRAEDQARKVAEAAAADETGSDHRRMSVTHPPSGTGHGQRPLVSHVENAEPQQARDDQVNGDDVIQEPGHDQNGDAGDDGQDGLKAGQRNGH